MHSYRTRYSRWDGTQQINPITPDEILRALADDLLNDGDLNLAMQRLFRFGFQGENGERFPGLREMLERLRQRKQDQLQQYDMGSVLKDIEERLKQIVANERETIEQRVEESRARQAEQQEVEQQSGDIQEGGRNEAADNDDLQKMLEQIAARKESQLDA